MEATIDLKKADLRNLCERFNVKELYLFGSATTSAFSDDSDLDFLVQFRRDSFEGAFDQFMDFKNELEKLYDRPVDLYNDKQFRNPIFQQEIERSRKLLYAA